MVGVFLLFVDAGGSHGCVVCRGRMGFNVLGFSTVENEDFCSSS